MNGYRCDEDIIQNLKDTGCDQDTIRTFMNDWQCGRQDQGTRLLQKHRRCLLNDLHKDQKRIDCLDYLLFMLGRGQGSKGANK